MVENDKFLQGFSYDPDPKADQEKLLNYVKIAVIIILINRRYYLNAISFL